MSWRDLNHSRYHSSWEGYRVVLLHKELIVWWHLVRHAGNRASPQPSCLSTWDKPFIGWLGLMLSVLTSLMSVWLACSILYSFLRNLLLSLHTNSHMSRRQAKLDWQSSCRPTSLRAWVIRGSNCRKMTEYLKPERGADLAITWPTFYFPSRSGASSTMWCRSSTTRILI